MAVDYTRAVNWIIQNAEKCNHSERYALVNPEKCAAYYFYINRLVRQGWNIEFTGKYVPILGEKKESYFTEEELEMGYVPPTYKELRNEYVCVPVFKTSFKDLLND